MTDRAAAPTPRSRSARTRMSSADRRTQLLDVAADIVSAGGERALTIEAVVAKAEVHRPIVYRHFENAEALLDAVLERELAELHRATLVAVADQVGFAPRLQAAVEAWMELFARSPLLMSIALVRKPSAPLLATRRKQQNASAVKFLVGELVDEGLTETDAEIVAVALFHALSGIVQLWGAKKINRRVAIDRFTRIAVGAAEACRTD